MHSWRRGDLQECIPRGINTNLVNNLKFEPGQHTVEAIDNVTNWSHSYLVNALLVIGKTLDKLGLHYLCAFCCENIISCKLNWDMVSIF